MARRRESITARCPELTRRVTHSYAIQTGRTGGMERGCGTGFRVPRLARRPAGEPQTEVFHPSPNTPSTASTSSPKKGKSVTHVSGTICHLCLGSLTAYCTATYKRLLFLPGIIPARSRSPSGLRRGFGCQQLLHILPLCIQRFWNISGFEDMRPARALKIH